MVLASSLATVGLGCRQTDPSVNESAPRLAKPEPPGASSPLATPAADPSAVVHSIRRRLRDFADGGRYEGETLDVWTCRRDQSCTSEGHTEVVLKDGGRLRSEWRHDYDSHGYSIRLHSKTTETGQPDAIDTYDFVDGTVRYTREAPDPVVREFDLPKGFLPCLLRCRQSIAQGGESSGECHSVYPDGPQRHEMAVRPVSDPRLGEVWERVVLQPEGGVKDVRLVDASCQQLEAHVMGSHSVLLSEERTGDPPVPAYAPYAR